MFMTRSIMLYFVIQLLFVTILLSLKIRARRTRVLSIIAIPVHKAETRTLWTLNNICRMKVKWPSWRDELQKQLKNMMVCFVIHICFLQFSSVQLLSLVQLFVTPWIAACQASLSITNSQSLLKLLSIESVMPSSHLIVISTHMDLQAQKSTLACMIISPGKESTIN